jgi:hypothetical protein
MKFNVSLGFKKLPQAELKMFARTVQIKMTNNLHFISLAPDVAILKTANDELSIAVANADDGNKEDTIIKNNSFKIVTDLLDDLAMKVNEIAKGDELIIYSSGFKLNKTPATVQEIATPFYAELINTSVAREAKVKWKCDPLGIKNYTVEYQIVGEDRWHIAGMTSSKEIFITGLVPGSIITARVCSNGTRNRQSEWANTLSVMIS